MERKSLKKSLDQGKLLIGNGACDVVTALLVERAGYDLVALQSGPITAAMGVPDIGIFLPLELLELTRKVAGRVNIPIIVDGEGGWGEPANFIYWIRELEKAGASGIHIDDYPSEYKCPHVKDSFVHKGRALGSAELTCQMIRAGVDARRNKDFLIIVRTGANYEPFPLQEGIRRAKLYKEAGADVLFVPYNGEKFMKFRDEVPPPFFIQPNNYLMKKPEEIKDDFHFWKWTEYHKIAQGGLVVNSPALTLLCSIQTIIEVLTKVKEAGTLKAAEGIPRISGELREELSGYPELYRVREKYPTQD